MVITYKELDCIKDNHQEIILSTGCFDLLHVGHLSFLEEAKKNGKILVVGILSDSFIKEKKGKQRPIINENDRLRLIDSLEIVDYTFLINESFETENYNFDISEEEKFFFKVYMPILERLKPDFLAYCSYLKISENEIKKIKDLKIKLVPIPLIDDISTTKIIEKIHEK